MTDETTKKIKDDPNFAIGSLLSVYSHQKEDEKISKTTTYRNAVGFNALDSDVLSSIAEQVLDRKIITPKQLSLVRSKMVKYQKQIEMFGVPPVSDVKVEDKVHKKGKIKSMRKYFEFLEGDFFKIVFPFSMETVHQIKNNLRDRRFNDNNKYWWCPASVENADILKSIGFEPSNRIQEWLETMSKTVQDMKIDYGELEVDKLKLTPRNYQLQGIKFLDTRKGRAIIADEMGTGKSLQAIAWMFFREVKPSLIICPASIKINWVREYEKVTGLKNIEMLQGTKPYTPSENILVINYDILHNWISELKKIKPKLIITDEAHKLKSSKAKRTKSTKMLAKTAEHFIALTGTPVENRPIEIFNVANMVKPNFFPSVWRFGREFCDLKHNGFAWDYTGASNTKKLHQVLQEIMIRRMKEDVLQELPNKMFSVVPMELNNKSEYKKAESDFIQYLKESDPKSVGKAKRAEHLVKLNRMRRLAVKGKLKTAIDWIQDFIEEEKLVLFCIHRDVVEEIAKKFKKEAVHLYGGMSSTVRQKAIDKFQNDDQIRLFVGNIEAAGEGITLHSASNAAFIEFPWKPSAVDQAADRIHRIGQESKSVNIYNLIAEKTVDEEMISLIDKKRNITSQITDGRPVSEEKMIKELMERYRNKTG